MERQLGGQVRLPTVDEFRAWFPILLDEDVSEDDDVEHIGVERLEEWSGVKGSPERIRFKADLKWTTSPQGISAISAWDVAEWVQNNNTVVVHPEGLFGCAPYTWGAYKRVKTVFRLVIEAS